MHIKHIHNMVEKLSETAKCELEKGIENVDTKEMGEVAEIIKELCEAEYYAKISKAMDEAEYGEEYDYMGAYDDRKGYRGQPRDSKGRYMSRRSYTKPMMMQDDEWDEMEKMRDMDRHSGRMGYVGTSNNANGMRTGSMDNSYSRSENARRGYMNAKELNKDKQEKMKELEAYMKELSTDVTEMIGDASPEEKTMLKNKMQMLMQKIQ